MEVLELTGTPFFWTLCGPTRPGSIRRDDSQPEEGGTLSASGSVRAPGKSDKKQGPPQRA